MNSGFILKPDANLEIVASWEKWDLMEAIMVSSEEGLVEAAVETPPAVADPVLSMNPLNMIEEKKFLWLEQRAI